MAFPLALAFLASSGVQAGGSIWSGLLQRDAAKEASALMADSSIRGMNFMRESQAEAMSILAPFLGRGNNAGDTLSRLLVSPKERGRQSALERQRLLSDVEQAKAAIPVWGQNYGMYQASPGPNQSERTAQIFSAAQAEKSQAYERAQEALTEFDKLAQVDASSGQDGAIEASPLYEWQRDVGTTYLDRSLAKKGLSKSGEGMKVLGDFVRGLGAEEADRQVGRVMGMYTVGASAATGMANVLGAFAPQIAGMQAQQGQAQAQGVLGAGQATSNMITGVGTAVNSGLGGYLTSEMFHDLMNKNKMRASAPAMDFDPALAGRQ